MAVQDQVPNQLLRQLKESTYVLYAGRKLYTSVADPGSGAFLTPRSGSGIGIQDEHPGSHFRQLKPFFGLKILKFLDADADPASGNLFDPGSEMEKFGSGTRDTYPVSATLFTTCTKASCILL
jgi:hypothetical protein